MSDVYIVDTETTGIGSNDQVIELAYVRIPFYVSSWSKIESLEVFQSYFLPTVPIHPEASKVNGLTYEKLLELGATEPPETATKIIESLDPGVLIGHYLQFDTRMLKIPPTRYATLCTQQLAKVLNKAGIIATTNNKLVTLFNELELDGELEGSLLDHTASTDILKTFCILRRMTKELPAVETISDLIHLVKKVK